jgi:hypothetical protein
MCLATFGEYSRCDDIVGEHKVTFSDDRSAQEANVNISIQEQDNGDIRLAYNFSNVNQNDVFSIEIYNSNNKLVYRKDDIKLNGTTQQEFLITKIENPWTENVLVTISLIKNNSNGDKGPRQHILRKTFSLKVVHPKAAIISHDKEVDLGVIRESPQGLSQSNSGRFSLEYAIYMDATLTLCSNNNFRLRHSGGNALMNYQVELDGLVISSHNSTNATVNLPHPTFGKYKSSKEFRVCVEAQQKTRNFPCGQYSDVITLTIAHNS